MTQPRKCRMGLLLMLAACTLFISLGVAMAQDTPAVTSEATTENQTTQERVEEPAQAGYHLGSWTVDGGGAMSNPDIGYALDSTIGQPDAAQWSGVSYSLAGGFWRVGTVAYRVYLPVVLKGG